MNENQTALSFHRRGDEATFIKRRRHISLVDPDDHGHEDPAGVPSALQAPA